MPEKTQTPKTRRWPFLALAASAFALVMTVGPIVATSGVDAGGSEQSHAGYNVGMMAARSAIAAAQSDAPSIDSAASDDEPVAIPASPVVAPIVDTDPDPVIEPVATEPPAIREDDAIDIILELSGDDITDGSTGTWKITVSNQGDEYLWGVYAYLEGLGQVACEHRQLDIGESTNCWANQITWTGDHEAIAWVTAWTTDRMVEEETSLGYTVGP